MSAINYKSYFNDIEKAEYKNFYPISKEHMNSVNKKTEFNIDFGDGFCTSKFQYYISGTLKKSDNSDYPADATIKLIDNFVPYLFTKIEVRKHNKLIDEIEYPGILSTIKGTITYSKTDSVNCNGFESSFNGGNFEAIGDLSHLGLGFFESINFPIYKGGFYLSFVRSEDDDAIYRWKKDATANLPGAGKITIDEFYIRVPILEFKTIKKIKLIEELTIAKNIIFHFKQFQCIRQSGISGSTYNFDITNIYRNIINPKFIIVCFQASRDKNQEKDPSQFDSQNVKNLRVKLNGHFYPDEMLNLDISENKHRILYKMFQDYKKVYYGSEEVYYSPNDFIVKRPIYVIDTTKSPTNISGAKNDIIVSIDFKNAISNQVSVVCYVIVVSEKILQYNILKNDIIPID